MALGDLSNSDFQNGRRPNDVGAMGMGIDGCGGNSPHPNHRVFSMSEQSTKFRNGNMRTEHGSLRRSGRGAISGKEARKSGADYPSYTSLPPLSTRELNRETQYLTLQFPTAQVAEEQGSCLRTVEQQKNGESGISTIKLFNWARRNARVRAEVARLIGLTGRVTDPDFMEGLTKIFDCIVRDDELAHSDAPPSAASHSPNDAGTVAGEEFDRLTGDLFGEI